MNTTLRNKLTRLQQRLRELRSVLVSYSGGVDSAVLLRIALDTLGRENVLAVTGRSPSLAQSELDDAVAIAAEIGAPHEFIDTAEFDNPNYTANPTDRCYHCKTELYDQLRAIAQQRNLATIITGTNADDLGDYRPGLQAAAEKQVVAPLADVGITKSELRALGADLGVRIADKPASPCLSSRIPYGQEVTPDKLARIDQAETTLRQLGFRECRVRHHHQLARIEVPPDQLDRFADPSLRTEIDRKLRALGFTYVTLDLRGFRSGSLNDVILGAGLRDT